MSFHDCIRFHRSTFAVNTIPLDSLEQDYVPRSHISPNQSDNPMNDPSGLALTKLGATTAKTTLRALSDGGYEPVLHPDGLINYRRPERDTGLTCECMLKEIKGVADDPPA